jgi:hypothetical protein
VAFVIWVFLVVGVLLVFAIAASVVGSEAFRLGHSPSTTVFDLDEAVEDVAEGLPADAQARLSYEDVRAVILVTIEHLRSRGLSALPGEEIATGEKDVVISDDDALAVVLGAVESRRLDVSDGDAALVVELLLAHLGRIGALGPPA